MTRAYAPVYYLLGLSMTLATLVLSILTLCGAIFAVGKVVWHTYGMFRGVRPSANSLANLVPFIAFALPGTLDANGQVHRSKMLVWLCIGVALVLASLGLRLAAGY
jgi:hypothetical protein